ncbi:MAG: HAMP domain-containing sensor histidine kinase [Bacteroidales bacterium]
MNEKLTLSACNFLIPEISQVLANENYPEVQLISYTANCSSNALNPTVVSDIASKSGSDSGIIVIAGSCYSPDNSKIRNNKDVKVVQLEQCFELILNPETIYHFIKQGYYIVSNGWLRNYEHHIQSWGFDKESARSFFQESMKSILLLDTKIPGDYMPDLLALSEYMSLPYEIIPVGLSHCKKYIDTIVLNWRNENEQRKLSDKLSEISRQSADHKLIFNQLETLVRLTNEKEIAQIGVQLINILFAPSEIVYKFVNNDQEESFEFKGFFNSSAFNSENSFSIEIKYVDELLGIVEVNGLQFPQFRRKYEEMGTVISQLFGMAIANARKYSELEHSKSLIAESENELRKSASELSVMNATKDKFFNIIAHDLKSPFNSIVGFSEMLVENIREKDYDNIGQYAGYILNSSQRAMDLLMNLMEWSRSQTGRIKFNPELFDLTIYINDITLLFGDIAGQKGIAIKKELPASTYVFADQAMISTVLRNLISNAIKFTKPGGEIIVSVRKEKDESIVSVKDNGIGIPQNSIDKLFRIDENFSTHGTSNEAGTGLGLILCKEFIEKHNKEIWIESEEGSGSTFYFTLPYDNVQV